MSALTPGQALQKLKHFCAYQERCHQEVKEKLYGFGLTTPEVESAISTLIEENYLNEERFAKAFAGGKFRMKQWGRVKIKYALKQKQISPYCIKLAMSEIDEDDYDRILTELVEKQWEALKSEKNIFNRLRKTQDFLIRKGYELDLIKSAIETHRARNNAR